MKEELLAYGLSEKEAELYVAACKLGDCTAHRLSEITGLRRSTVYDITQSLEKKGLLASYKKDKKYFFSANNPNALITRLKEKEQVAKRLIPELKRLKRDQIEKENITIYKGKVGLRTATDEMLSSKEILVYGGSIHADKIFGSYTANFAQKRAERKIFLKTIIGPTIPKHMIGKGVKKYTPIRTLPLFENHKTTYFIYNETVVVWSLTEELTAIKIQSKAFVESQKQIFNFLWSIAKKSEKN